VNQYTNKLENLEEMEIFLNSYDYPKLNQENINYLNRFITHNGIEPEKSLPNMKNAGPHGFYSEFYRTFKELIQAFF
jgi:hypothetical protein